MSDRDRTADRRECGGDVAAYALGALDAAEAETFRRHLETCSVCKEELASFQQVVNELPLAAPRHKAPAAMRRKVMRDVSADSRRAGRPAPRTAVGWRGWLVPRPVLAAGVALLVAVGVFVAVQSGSSGTRVIDAQVAGPGSAQLRVSHGHGSLVLRHFAPPPAGKIYEVWVRARKGGALPHERAVRRHLLGQRRRRRPRQPARRLNRDGHPGAGGRQRQAHPRARHHGVADVTVAAAMIQSRSRSVAHRQPPSTIGA